MFFNFISPCNKYVINNLQNLSPTYFMLQFLNFLTMFSVFKSLVKMHTQATKRKLFNTNYFLTILCNKKHIL